MKIPTEEQINYIGKNLPTWGCEYGGECVPAPEVIEKIIIEWEKLKNQSKEDICKNCPFLGYEGSGEICTIYYKLQNYDLAHLGCNEQRINNCPIKDIRK